MKPRRRRIARHRRRARDLATHPGVRLAIACAWRHLAAVARPLGPDNRAEDDDASWERWTQAYNAQAEAAFPLRMSSTSALAALRTDHGLRAVAAAEFRRLGLPAVAVMSFGPGWRERGHVALGDAS